MHSQEEINEKEKRNENENENENEKGKERKENEGFVRTWDIKIKAPKELV
jgi:hypothetical protein